MFAGHFAIGVAIKARRPDIPTLPILMGVGFLDILNGIFIATGIDKVTPDPERGPYLFFDLTFIDWDHSFLMTLFWALCWGAVFIKNRQVAIIAAFAVITHYFADWIFHNKDLALYPYSEYHYGLGLWDKLGVWSWVLEGVIVGALSIYAWRENVRRGIHDIWTYLLLAGFFILFSPWFSPMKGLAAGGVGDATASVPLLITIVTSVGFIIPGLLFTFLINHAANKANLKNEE